MTVKRKLTTIFCADVVGYSRLMGVDETGTLQRLKGCRELMAGFIEHHHGRVVSWSGDAVLADFSSVVEAVQCAIEVQRELKARNETINASERMEFRIGINLGDVMIEDHDIFGEGVNIAARLQTLAPAGGILISGSVHEQVRNKLSVGFNFLGPQQVKNIAEHVPAYVVRAEIAEMAVATSLTMDQVASATSSSQVVAWRMAAGMIDAAMSSAVVLGVTLPLSSVGLQVAEFGIPLNLLTTEREVRREDPTTEILDGGALVVTKSETTVNRTTLGIATQTFVITQIERERVASATKRLAQPTTERSQTTQMVDPKSGQPLNPPPFWLLALASYGLLMCLTEGAGTKRRSPGKAILGLTVNDLQGRPLNATAAVLRNIAKVASAIPLFAGFFLALRSKRGQALHDLIAGAQIVRK